MIIDYKTIEEQTELKFKGGNGELVTRNFVDDKNKIMMSYLKPGANIGYHQHELNSEIIYILSGEGHFEYDGTIEKVKAGDVHYCPEGHGHSMTNPYEEDLIFFGVVPKK